MSFESDSIQRCPHDKEHPYTLVSRELIRNQSISPECRWLIIYLLANAPGWKIHVRQIINHCKGFMGRDKVYSVFGEAIEAGYLKKEKYQEKGLERVRYFISEDPKFKKCLPLPENPDAGNPDTEKTDAKERVSVKEEHIKESAKAHSPDQSETACPRLRSEIRFDFSTERFENIEIRDIDSWKELYPTVNIDRELKAMTEWLHSNPHKARNKKRWRAFINRWLSSNNDKNVNLEAARSRGYSNEIDRRPRDQFGNVKESQYKDVFQ